MIFIPFFCASQIKGGNNTLLQQTFGYLQSQRFMLETIEKKYPELSLEASIAKLEFHKNFGKAIGYINFKMKEYHDSSFENHLVNLEKVANTNFQNLSKYDAKLFIQTVKKRARGIIKSPYQEILLRYQYFDNPVAEIKDRHYRIHSVANISNSTKTKLTVSIPKSWQEISSSNSPIVLKKFRSKDDFGGEIITISRQFLKPEVIKPEASLKKEIQKFIPVNAHHLSTNHTLINKRFVYKKQYQDKSSDTTSKFKRYGYIYAFEHKNQLFVIDFSIYRSLNDIFNKEKFEPLIESILKSITIEINFFSKNTLSSKYQ